MDRSAGIGFNWRLSASPIQFAAFLSKLSDCAHGLGKNWSAGVISDIGSLRTEPYLHIVTHTGKPMTASLLEKLSAAPGVWPTSSLWPLRSYSRGTLEFGLKEPELRPIK